VSTAEILQQIRSLSSEQRQEVLTQIQEEFGAEIEITSAQARELDWRLEEHARHPNDVVPWNEIKAATEAKYGRKL